MQTGIKEHRFSNNSNQKQEHSVTLGGRFAFTIDDLFVVYSSFTGSLHALSLRTGTVFTSVHGHNLFYFTRERQIGYLFHSGTEERTIFLRNLFNPFKFLSLSPAVKTAVVRKSIATIFASSDTVMSVSSDSKVALWITSDETKGFAFKFLSESSLTVSSSQVLHVKTCVISANGKLIAFHHETKIELHSFAESREFHCTVYQAESGLTDVSLTFSADSTLLLFCVQCSINEPHFFVWDVQKETMSTSFKSPGLLTVECCCLSSDNRELFLCGEYEIEIWEYDNKRPRRLLTRMGVERSYHSVKFSQCAVSLDNELLVCCIANIIIVYSLRVLDIHSSKRVLRGHLGRIEFCKFLKVNRYLISYGVDGMVFLWDVIKSKAAAFTRIAQGQENVVSMAVSPEEDRVVCFTSSGRVCEIKLCKLECAPSPKFLATSMEDKLHTAETRLQLSGEIASTSRSTAETIEDETFSSSDSEEDMYDYYEQHDDIGEFD